MYAHPMKVMLAILVGSIAGALLRYLTALAPVASASTLHTIVISGVGGAILGALLGFALTMADEGAGRWLIAVLLVAAIAAFGATAVLAIAKIGADGVLGAALINIGATILASLCSAGVIYRRRSNQSRGT